MAQVYGPPFRVWGLVLGLNSNHPFRVSGLGFSLGAYLALEPSL